VRTGGFIRRIRTLIVSGAVASAIFTNNAIAAEANHLPSEQQVLRFLADTIDWYRHLPTVEQIGTTPADLLFLEDNRSITTEIVRLSFEFGKVAAAIDPADNPAEAAFTLAPAGARPELQDLVTAKAKVDSNAQQAINQLNSLTQTTLTARYVDREKRSAQMAEIRRRIQLLSVMSANYQTLLTFIRAASADPDRAASLAVVIENLQHDVPDVFAAAPPSQTSNLAADPASVRYGIMGGISQVSALARKERVIDGVIKGTDALSKSLQGIRAPIRESFRKELPTYAWDASNLDVLQQQESRLTDLIAEAKTVSPAEPLSYPPRGMAFRSTERISHSMETPPDPFGCSWGRHCNPDRNPDGGAPADLQAGEPSRYPSDVSSRRARFVMADHWFPRPILVCP